MEEMASLKVAIAPLIFTRPELPVGEAHKPLASGWDACFFYPAPTCQEPSAGLQSLSGKPLAVKVGIVPENELKVQSRIMANWNELKLPIQPSQLFLPVLDPSVYYCKSNLLEHFKQKQCIHATTGAQIVYLQYGGPSFYQWLVTHFGYYSTIPLPTQFHFIVILYRVTRAVQILARLGIDHVDTHIANIVISHTDGLPRIIDFGQAVLQNKAFKTNSLDELKGGGLRLFHDEPIFTALSRLTILPKSTISILSRPTSTTLDVVTNVLGNELVRLKLKHFLIE